VTGVRDRVALVTGGAGGIGEAVVRRFLGDGCRVASLDLAAPEQTGGGDGAGVLHVRGDVSSEPDVERAVAQTVEEFGRLDVLVNNAGVNAYFDPAEMAEQDWERFMGVDLKGVWLCSKHAIPELRRAGGGVIVNIASIHAHLTTRGMFPYAAAKAGVVGLTRSLALDLGPDNIRVVAVCPGWITTRLVEESLDRTPDPAEARRRVLAEHPLGRLGRPEDVAGFVAYLASDDAGFITGVPLLIDGGLSAHFAS
jgi:NAD(P)-dependent dehydrogenase (short-subunit alcohol dehydrogenase family)